MKVQDIAFIIVLLIVIMRRSSRTALIIGLCTLALAIPLYARWIFFTAERLVMYGGVFILVASIQQLFSTKK